MKPLILFATIIFYAAFCFAQTDTTKAAPADSTASRSTLTVAAVYANNASYYGQKSAESTPYAALAATVRFKSGFYFTGLPSGYYLLLLSKQYHTGKTIFLKTHTSLLPWPFHLQ